MTAKTRTILAALSVPMRIYMGVVFIMAALFKIYEPYQFGLSVATYQMAPLELINVFAIILPWVELFVGVAFIVGFWTRANGALIVAMMLMFLTALSWALSHDLQMSCGCFASQETADEIGFHTIVRDLVWLALGLFPTLFDDGRFGLDGWIRKRSTQRVEQ